MNILKIKQLHDCVDEPFAKEMHFDKRIDLNFIEYISFYGNLRYFSEFPKPYYQILIPEIALIKGIEGNSYAQVIFSKENQNSAQKWFTELVNDYKFREAA